MGKSIEERRAAGQQGHETWHGGNRDNHLREAAKYRAQADELEAKGKTKAAARARKVAERNERLAAKHAAKLDESYQGYQTKMANDLAAVEAEQGRSATRAQRKEAFRNRKE